MARQGWMQRVLRRGGCNLYNVLLSDPNNYGGIYSQYALKHYALANPFHFLFLKMRF